jgi:nucleoside-diphosphate-sugar epimerase
MEFPGGLASQFLQYQARKLLAHQACRDWSRDNQPDISVITVHPSQVFGPSLVQKSAQDISGVNLLIDATFRSTTDDIFPHG